jgi:hypothetical protein
MCFLLRQVGEAALFNRHLLPRTHEMLSELHHIYELAALLLQGCVLAASSHLGVTQTLFEACLLHLVLHGSGSSAPVATSVYCSNDLPGLFSHVRCKDASALVMGGDAKATSFTSRRERWRRLLCLVVILFVHHGASYLKS